MSWKKELEKRVKEVFTGLEFELIQDEQLAVVDGRYVAALPADEDETPGLWVTEMLKPDPDAAEFLGVIESL